MVDFLDQHVASLEDVRAIGKPLRGQLSGLWRYRVGDYRILCDLYDKELVVLVLLLDIEKIYIKVKENLSENILIVRALSK
nr:type II toxin-antitoxin system RelE/ParE family toxin [Bartonella sp. CDC_skunk]